MAERISSLDSGYQTGDLSLFPDVLDDKDSLYEVKNNAETKLRTGLAFNGKKILVLSTESFPDKGLLRVGPPSGTGGEAELIYYDSKTSDTFKDLIRGFSGSRQNQWAAGSWATNAVCAEPHNAIKDALINIEQRIGLEYAPEEGSLHKRLKDLENKFLAPKALFRAYPRKIRPGKSVRFQNFSEGDVVRYLWDFGDGSQSVEKNPTHTYQSEGTYTVKLHLITSKGAQGISTKNNYVTVSDEENVAFFYAVQMDEKTYKFIDQTDGDIIQRYWVFGDGENYIETDPSKHEVIHTYDVPSGSKLEPSLLVAFANEKIKRIFLSDKLEIE